MKDDSLNDTQQSDIVGTIGIAGELDKAIWNAAIEAAAGVIDQLSADKYRANEIRKLKK